MKIFWNARKKWLYTRIFQKPLLSTFPLENIFPCHFENWGKFKVQKDLSRTYYLTWT
jgi:hypothetical protein